MCKRKVVFELDVFEVEVAELEFEDAGEVDGNETVVAENLADDGEDISARSGRGLRRFFGFHREVGAW